MGLRMGETMNEYRILVWKPLEKLYIETVRYVLCFQQFYSKSVHINSYEHFI
jgi:hypothetical protein